MQLSSTQKIIAIALVAFLFLFFATGRKSDKNRPSQTYSQEAYDTVHGTHVLTDGCADAKKTKLNLLEEAIDAVFDGEFRQAGKKLAYLNVFSTVDCKTTNVPVKISPPQSEPFADAPPQPNVPPKTSQTASQNNDFAQALDSFPLASSTWGDTLNPSKNYPSSGFTSYYFNTENPKTVLQQQNTPVIAVKYAWSDLLNIPSEKFGSYWVGKIMNNDAQYYDINVNKSWSKSRILIDRHIVLEQGQHNESGKVYLPKGEHIIEVEYLNHWHTTDFSVKIQPLLSTKTAQDPSQFVQDILKQYPNAVGYYAGAYEPQNHSIIVNVAGESRPVVLFLSSYRAVDWQIQPSGGTQVVGAVYGAYDKGSEIKGLSSDRVVNVGKRFGGYEVKAEAKNDCHCNGGNFYCGSQETGIFQDLKNLAFNYKIPMVGYDGAYHPDFLVPSNNKLSQTNLMASSQQQEQERLRLKQACDAQKTGNFEKLYQ